MALCRGGENGRMPKTLRIFISSPGDVPDERLRAALVIDKLAQDYRRYFSFEVIRWEHEPLLASGHFQDALDPPSKADIVVLILWSRLGTPLPEKTAVREYHGIDGRAPVTGTEWEFEDALRSAREHKAPDLLAFRNTSPAPVDPRDPTARARSVAQLDALDAFWRRHFADRGVFLAAYDEYSTLEAFALRLEQSLRALIERRIKEMPAGAEAPAATWFGPPFRGLQAYGFEHAAIFFGRDAVVAKAAEQLAARARAGTAFLLVSGASGSGKSSLVQAALVPRLMQPQRIQGMAFLRRQVFRPGGGSDPVLGLIESLTRAAGEDVGLPELLGPGQSAADLAAHLRAAADKPGFVFTGALGRLTEAGRASGRLLGFEEAKLILVVDQFEELFTSATISSDDRALFMRLIAGLAHSGAVWVVATLRADFWHRAAENPELLALAEGDGRIDVAAPSAAELAEMIRKPAQAAGIGFETHGKSGLGLDAVLAEHAAAAPGVLPLLSFTLDALYAEDVVKRGGNLLTFATYEALGGLDGAIAKRADEIVASLPESAQAAVPRVLRALATVAQGTEQVAVSRVAPLSAFPQGSPARAVVDAFTQARLLVAADAGDAPTVRLAHEALIGRWEKARAQLASDRRDLETRAVIEQQQARWEKASGRAQKQLLLRDPDLANAVDLAKRWSDELGDKTNDFIAASRRRARLRLQLTAAAAVLFAFVAVAASVLGVIAHREQQRAEQALHAATATANGLVFDLAQRFRNVSGVPTSLIKDMLDRARALQEQLTQNGDVPPELRRSQIAALTEISNTLLDQGDSKGAFEAADRARQLVETLLKREPNVADWQRILSICDVKLGDVRVAQGNLPAALKYYETSLAIEERLAKANPEWARGLAVTQQKIGNVQVAQGHLAEALTSYRADLAITQRLAAANPNNSDFQRDVSLSNNSVGSVLMAQGHLDEALKYFRDGLALAEKLSKTAPGNVLWLRDVSVSQDKVGDVLLAKGELAGAMASFKASLAIREKLAKSDPGNAGWQRDLLIGYNKVGDVLKVQGDLPGALQAYQQHLAIAERLVKSDPANARWQDDLVTAHNRIGDLLMAQGKPAQALQSFRAGLSIAERQAKADPSSADWQDELSLSFSKIADALAAQGDLAGAETAYRQCLKIGEHLAQSDKANGARQRDLAVDYERLGDIQKRQGKLPDALESYRKAVSLMLTLAALEPGNPAWQRDLAVADNMVGDTLILQNSLPKALEAYQAALDIAKTLVKAQPDNALWQRDLLFTYNRVGMLLATQNKPAEAEAAYQASLVIAERMAKLQPTNIRAQRDLALGYDLTGEAQRRQGNLAGALKSFQAGAAVRAALLKTDPANTAWQHELAVTEDKIGDLQRRQGDLPAALKSYQQALDILRQLVARDGDNAAWQRDLAIAYNNVGDALTAQKDMTSALQSYQAAQAIAQKLVKSQPGNSLWQRDLEVSDNRVGVLLMRQGRLAEAEASFRAALAIAEQRAAQQPGDTGAQRDIAFAYDKIGNVLQAQKKNADALASYRASLAIREQLAKLHPENVLWQTDLAVALDNVGTLSAPAEARATLTRALAILEALAQAGKLTPAQQSWPRIVREALAKLPP